MAALSDADRTYLSRDWRWAEQSSAAIRTRHPGAREADYGSAFMTEAGALAALTIISDMTQGGKRVIRAVADALIEVSFKGRPPRCRLYFDRLGGDPVNGQLFVVEGVVKDYEAKRTILQLIG